MISSIVKSIFKIIWEVFMVLYECFYVIKYSIELTNGYDKMLVISIVILSICGIFMGIFTILNIKALKEYCDIADRKMLEEVQNAEDKG